MHPRLQQKNARVRFFVGKLFIRRGNTSWYYVHTMRSPIHFSFFGASLITLAVVHILATQFSLYWKYSWFDIPTHLLGGMVIVFGIFLVPLFGVRLHKRHYSFWYVLGYVLLIGIAWELFEMAIGMTRFETNVVNDLLIDLAMDLVGGALGFYIMQKLKIF